MKDLETTTDTASGAITTGDQMSVDEILANLEEQAVNVCYHEPSSPVEQRLANIISCLIAVIRHKMAKG